MDKFFIRKIVSVWAFNKLNEAVWKCNSIDKLKITQEGTTIRKKDAQGATIFRMDTAKSANISFETSYWDLKVLSAISGAEEQKLDGTGNPYLIEPIAVPYTQTKTLSAEDISNGYITLDETPRSNEYHYYEIALHTIDKADDIVTCYHQGVAADASHFSVSGQNLMLPTSLQEGESIETVYEYNSYYGSKLINTADDVPETWKVKILMLVSPICNSDIVSAIWITAKNATPAIQFSLDFGVEDNIPINLELGYSICDDKKELYEIIPVTELGEESELRTHDTEVVYTSDEQAVKTIR